MFGLLIADDDTANRTRLAGLLEEEGYEVVSTDSVAHVVEGILKNAAKVVILGGKIGGFAVTEILPILKRCQGDIRVIVASEETSLPLLRRLRREGIFYHLLKPLSTDDWEEVRQVVQCAFENCRRETTALTRA